MHLYLPASLLKSARALLHALMPGNCALCGDAASKEVLCAACIAQFFSLHTARCPICAAASSTDNQSTDNQICGACMSAPPAFDATFVVCDYEPPVDHLVQDLKFNACLALAPMFARLLAQAVEQNKIEADWMMGVPLSASRLSQRGFNQAVEIAKPLARALAIPFAPALCLRVRDTQAQAGLPLAQRQLNIQGAFALSLEGRSAVLHKHIVVVDDVMTTGHTLHELAACLKRHGATRVSNLVFARTPAR